MATPPELSPQFVPSAELPSVQMWEPKKPQRNAKHYKFQTLTTDSLSLSGAASTWLTVLKATNPPPGYQTAKARLPHGCDAR